MTPATDPASLPRLIAGSGTGADAWRADPALAAVPSIPFDELAPPGRRVVVVAPHPDDEILTCGGLLQMLGQRGAPALVVAVTDGEGSHPGSPAWPPARLRRVRAAETDAALSCLADAPAARASLVRLGLPDGGVRANEAALAARLAGIVGPDDVVITTWCFDGHPDHEATARAARTAARGQGARLLQVPVWGWHWSAPGDGAIPLARARKLVLGPPLLARKRQALACFTSQVEGDASTGAGPILPAFALERALQPFELYLELNLHDDR